MDSFHRSRARVSFEILCALGLSASLVGAWMQTFASAFLPAAGIAALYAVVHAFDLRGRKPAAVPTREVAESAPEPKPAVDTPTDYGAAGTAEPTPPDKPARKARANRGGAPKKAKAGSSAPAAEPARLKDATVFQLRRQEEAPLADDAALEESEAGAGPPADDVAHLPVAPLFEPEPFVRQQRTVFGRKAGY